MKEVADQGSFIRQDSLHKFNKMVHESKDNLHEERIFKDLDDLKLQDAFSDQMRDTKMSFASIVRDDTRNV